MSSITVKPLSYLFTKAPLQDEDYAGFISKLISNCLFFSQNSVKNLLSTEICKTYIWRI